MSKRLVREIIAAANHIGYLATIDNGAPRVRPIDMYINDKDNFLTATFANSKKVKQLEKCKLVEICFYDGHEQLVRIAGEMEFVVDRGQKEDFARLNPHVNNDFQGVDDPYYTLLRLCPKKVEFMKTGDYKYITVDW